MDTSTNLSELKHKLMPEALSVRDAALFTGVSRSTFYGLLKAKKISSFLIGGRRLVRRETLQTFLLREEQLTNGGAE